MLRLEFLRSQKNPMGTMKTNVGTFYGLVLYVVNNHLMEATSTKDFLLHYIVKALLICYISLIVYGPA